MALARWITRGLATLLLLAAGAGACRADPIRYEFGGVISSIGSDTGMTPGMRFSGTFTYDPDKAQAILSAPHHTQFEYGSYDPSGPSVLTLSVAGNPVLRPMPVASYSLGQSVAPAEPSTTLWISDFYYQQFGARQMEILLGNSGRAVFPDTNDSTALPHVLNLTDFTDASITTYTPNNDGISPGFSGTIDALSVVPVPEPASWIVFGLIAATGVLTRRGLKS